MGKYVPVVSSLLLSLCINGYKRKYMVYVHVRGVEDLEKVVSSSLIWLLFFSIAHITPAVLSVQKYTYLTYPVSRSKSRLPWILIRIHVIYAGRLTETRDSDIPKVGESKMFCKRHDHPESCSARDRPVQLG